MRPILLALALLLTTGPFRLVSAADDPRLPALQAADDARIAAFVAADPAQLGEILSDDLHYAHASGAVDTKTSLLEAMSSGKLKYLALNYEERTFTFPAPKIALMSGKARLQVNTPNGPVEIPASFLAVWREEKGGWHFLAWQSAKITPPAK